MGQPYYNFLSADEQVTLTVNQLVDSPWPEPDGFGVYWFLKYLDGWDSADVRSVTLDKYGEEGIYVAVQEYSSRLLTATEGYGHAPDADTRTFAERQLSQLFNATKRTGRMTVTVTEEIPRYVTGYLNSKISWVDIPPGNVMGIEGIRYPFKWQAEVLCDYPVKRAVSQRTQVLTSTLTTVTNGGDFQALPNVTIANGADGDILTDNLGNQITLTTRFRTIPATLNVNFLTRQVTDGAGISAYGVIGNQQWFAIEPYSDTEMAYGNGAHHTPGTATVHWSDAWI